MISNFLIKLTPFISTLILIIILGVSNQKENTRLKILIWNTPQLSLGNYLVISTATGFLLSYFLTTKLAKTCQTKPKEFLKFKNEDIDVDEEINEYNKTNSYQFEENTLIERDIKDPSPTINASFRVIGRTERINTNAVINNDRFDNSIEYDEKFEKNETISQVNSISNDWDDESFSKW
tara:strand:+ start:825 stop:1361 length:537 start_codon:yes stop_codon:yes gene_type:complete